jgi:DNA-directed RNA polymerase subunit D
MNIEIVELTETSAKFIISDVNPSFVNAIRRTLMAEVPKMAIEDVEFHLGAIQDEDGKVYESISPLFDEIIAHRLGMVPIPTDLKHSKFRAECKCGGEGCPACTIMYSINKKGPCVVYSGDLEPIGDTKLKVKDELIPIVKLAEGQALLIYATAVLGTGKEHAKWSSVCGVGYQYYPILKIDSAKCDRDLRCVESCPKKILKLEGDKIGVENILACNLCKSCMEVCETGAIKVSADDSKFIFSFETDGAVDAKNAFEYSLKLLEAKYTDFREKVSNLFG